MAQVQTDPTLMQKYTLRPAVDILRDLYGLKQRQRSGEEIFQPLLTIMPGNKLPVRGFLIDFKDDKDQRGVVLELEGTSNVLFLELYWITGVVIHDADRVAIYLIDLSAADGVSSATRIDLKTTIRKECEKLKQNIADITIAIADEDLPANGQQLYVTSLFVIDVAMSLVEISKTELGKQSIQEGIKTIVIKKGASLDLKLSGGTLTIGYDFYRCYTTNSARRALLDHLYNLL
jgi:hypothetical protein